MYLAWLVFVFITVVVAPLYFCLGVILGTYLYEDWRHWMDDLNRASKKRRRQKEKWEENRYGDK